MVLLIKFEVCLVLDFYICINKIYCLDKIWLNEEVNDMCKINFLFNFLI